MIDREFITAGRAIFTVRVPVHWSPVSGKDSWTYRVERKPADDDHPRDIYFVSLLVGPDNMMDYQYMGILDPATGHVRLTKGSLVTADSFVYRMVNWFLKSLWDTENPGREILDKGAAIDHSGRCARCARELTTPESLDTGYGPECAKKVGVAWKRDKPTCKNPSKMVTMTP